MGFYRNIRIKIRKCQEEDDEIFEKLIKELEERTDKIIYKYFPEEVEKNSE